MRGPIADLISSGSSSTVTPPVSRVASSSAGISVSHSFRRLGEHHRDVLRADAPREQPFACLGVLERLGEQLVQEQDLDAALAHQVDEGVELLAGAAHPDDVVEEQLVAVRRREPFVREVGPVHHHRLELADLGVRSQTVSVAVLMRALLSCSTERGGDADERADDDEDGQEDTARRTSGSGRNRPSRAPGRP